MAIGSDCATFASNENTQRTDAAGNEGTRFLRAELLMTLASAYRARVSTGLIEADRDQLAALQLLEELGSSMLAGKARLGGLLGKSRRSKSGGGCIFGVE